MMMNLGALGIDFYFSKSLRDSPADPQAKKNLVRLEVHGIQRAVIFLLRSGYGCYRLSEERANNQR
jgi:hypothetical protein